MALVLEKEHWEVVSVPAIAEEAQTDVIDTPLGSRLFTCRAGDLLHPEREFHAT